MTSCMSVGDSDKLGMQASAAATDYDKLKQDEAAG